MFHSQKKKEKQIITEDEQKKIEDKLDKIKAIQTRILKMKNDKEKVSVIVSFFIIIL